MKLDQPLARFPFAARFWYKQWGFESAVRNVMRTSQVPKDVAEEFVRHVTTHPAYANDYILFRKERT